MQEKGSEALVRFDHDAKKKHKKKPSAVIQHV